METPLNLSGAVNPLELPVSKLMFPNASFESSLQSSWEQVRTNQPGGVVHWWGHSWEFTDTKRLTNALAGYLQKPGVWYATQGELALWIWLRNNTVTTVTHPQPGETVVRLSHTALHPFLDHLPFAVTVPPGVTNVTVQGIPLTLTNGVASFLPAPPLSAQHL
jgi:hypothetical protein